MKKLFVTISSISAFFMSQQAAAALLLLTAQGQVTASRLYDYTTNTNSSAPAGLINIGDRFSFTAIFDTDQAVVSPLYDADPTVNIYFLNGSLAEIRSGSYSSPFKPKFNISATAQLWNDRPVGNALVDSQSFEFSNYDYGGPFPYALTNRGVYSELVGIQSFDFTHLIRNNDLISQLIASSSAFSSNSMSYSFGTSDRTGKSYEAVFLTIGSVSYTISAIPEPASWAMIIAGFGVIGLKMRHRKKASAVIRMS